MRFFLILTAVIAALLYALFLLRDLPPPERLVFAAGARDGGYWKIAEQYRTILARDDIEVEILETAGSVENVELLARREADVGLLQGGIATDGAGIVALATVFVEPVIIFARVDRPVGPNPALWRGLTIARDIMGSGTRVVADELVGALGIGPPLNALADLGGHAAATALLDGEVDVALFVAPIDAPYLQPLLASDSVDLVLLDHPEAVSLRLPYSQVANAPAGAVSLDPVVPAEPLDVVALLARLAAVPGLHPAIVDRMVLAAREIHGGHGVFSRQGQFPTPEGAGMPLDPGAVKLVTEGQSFFHAWLPYWIAAQIRRVMLVLLPLLIFVVPAIRSLPAVYRWSMRRRVWRHYRAIGEVETELASAKGTEALLRLDERLAALDHRLAEINLPPAFRDGAFNARLHVDLVRRRIADRLGEQPHSAGGNVVRDLHSRR